MIMNGFEMYVARDTFLVLIVGIIELNWLYAFMSSESKTCARRYVHVFNVYSNP
jgi:hypothetical protein